MSKKIKILKFKVINNYPGMLHKIGDIIRTYESGTAYLYGVDDGYGCGPTEKDSCSDYPHLFEKIEEFYE